MRDRWRRELDREEDDEGVRENEEEETEINTCVESEIH